MPQMAPISWLFLFLIFSITFILFNILNYYIFLYPSSSENQISKKSLKSLNWKW
uniref:ATP synthase complex subunit 8 n=1 Tax=Megaselia spiracularis TaxID=940223 RepID=A0A6B9U2K8_9MUSC|nr:ATP synthase F0 subunit 8 [Megaselia spiracularis]